jgi:hypothetical protein
MDWTIKILKVAYKTEGFYYKSGTIPYNGIVFNYNSGFLSSYSKH